MNVFYATTNPIKFNRYKKPLAKHGITLVQKPVNIEELQVDDGDQLVRRKLQDTYDIVHKPVLVTDDSWDIPALNGFPSTNMKQCNQRLVPEDWLRLMKGVDDRRIFLTHHLGYTTGEDTFITAFTEEAYFLEESRGETPNTPHLTVIAWKGDIQSAAEGIQAGQTSNQEFEAFLGDLGAKIKAMTSSSSKTA